jgi:hypothetical protein
MNSNVPAAEIKWLRDTNSVQLLAWVKDLERFDAWLVIPVLPSVGGGAGIFATPVLIDPDQSSPVVGLMSMKTRLKGGWGFLESTVAYSTPLFPSLGRPWREIRWNTFNL